ncbi:hypothetical protein [Aquaspirillum sp. LM1]|uniref:hypothetical protein n=1 Tax=Aquaspirillum sp. LM1 TaxID=1938604 RepID=UPI00209B3FCA|nr:hypothetical protein [Aquaspirillum sp. LM1]
MSQPLPSPPSLLAPPPRLYLGCLALAMGLQCFWPLPLGMPLNGRLALGVGPAPRAIRARIASTWCGMAHLPGRATRCMWP